MKNYILVLLCLVAFNACKVIKPTAKKPETAQIEKPKVKEKTPVIVAINGKYMFQDTTKVKVFMTVEFDDLPDNVGYEKLDEFFIVQWAVLSDNGVREKLQTGKIDFNDKNFKRQGNAFQFSYDFPFVKNVTACPLVIEFVDRIKLVKYTNEQLVNFASKKVNTKYLIFDDKNSEFPSFQTFRLQDKPFVVKSLIPHSEKLYLKRYKDKTRPALSPMSSNKTNPYSEVEADSTFEITPNQEIALHNEGLYVLTENPESHTDGYSFIVVNDLYPRNTYPEELKECVIYMSTPKEIELIKNTEDAKTAMDMYFLNMTKGNEAQAKQIIRSYYRRVAMANTLFTTYKEGWKTDKGMIYVVMGPPYKIQKNKNREVWVYAQTRNTSEISFTFYQKANDFSDQTYELVRYPEYSSFWYPYVEAWRTGNVVE